MGETLENIYTAITRKHARDDKEVTDRITPCRCGTCGSKNTYCIFFESSGSNIGYYELKEFICNDCGKYTVYEYEWDT